MRPTEEYRRSRRHQGRLCLVIDLVRELRFDSVQLKVQYTDSTGTTAAQQYSITFARFIKHFVLAGAGFTPSAQLLARGLGAVAWYWPFLAPTASGKSNFGEPIPILRDPTLKAHFSNLAGRAFADFLGRQIEQAWVTLTYEGVLIASGMQPVGNRPDLLAINPSWVVAIEAKGYTQGSVSLADMQVHKVQAAAGPLLRDSWAACVAYSLYDSTKVKYLDPTDDRPKPEIPATTNLLSNYFELVGTAAMELPRIQRRIDGRDVWAVPLMEVLRGRVPVDVDASVLLNQIELLIDRDFAERFATLNRLKAIQTPTTPRRERHPIERPPVFNGEAVFVDSDGIGIAIGLG